MADQGTDWVENVKLNAEIYGIRGRGWLRLLFQLLGIAMVALGGYNLLVPRATAAPFIRFYTWVAPEIIYVNGDAFSGSAILVADVVVIVVGAVVAYLSS